MICGGEGREGERKQGRKGGWAGFCGRWRVGGKTIASYKKISG